MSNEVPSLPTGESSKELIRVGLISGCRRFPPIKDLLVVNGEIEGRILDKSILIDGGASCNVIDAALVRKLGLGTSLLNNQIQIKMANGVSEKCMYMVESTNVKVKEYEGKQSFLGMNSIDGFSVILGRPFLVSSKAIVDHGNDEITFRTAAKLGMPTKSNVSILVNEESPGRFKSNEPDVDDDGRTERNKTREPESLKAKQLWKKV